MRGEEHSLDFACQVDLSTAYLLLTGSILIRNRKDQETRRQAENDSFLIYNRSGIVC